MTQPFWRWTGWLSLGLAGCLHGNVPKSQVQVGPRERDRSRQIVPVSEQRAHARLLASAIPGPTMGSAKSKSIDCPTCSSEECAKQAAAGSAAEFVPVAVPAAELPVPSPMTITPYQAPVAWTAEEPQPFAAKTPAIPISQSTGVRTSGKPSLDDDFFPDDHEPSAKSPVRQTSNENTADAPSLDQPDESARQKPRPPMAEEAPQSTKQESPDVAKQLTDSLPEGTAAQPRDVALLVDQVFEDLRQRRLADARQRTEWLKQLVARRSSQPEVSEPRMLDEDIQTATPIQPGEVEDFFDGQDRKSK